MSSFLPKSDSSSTPYAEPIRRVSSKASPVVSNGASPGTKSQIVDLATQTIFQPENGGIDLRANVHDQQIRLARFINDFLEKVQSDNFEFGKQTNTERYVLQQLSVDPLVTQCALNQIFISNYSNTRIAIAILQIASHIERYKLYPTSDSIALAALNHVSLEVRECGVRAYEAWEDATAIQILKSISLTPAWLEEYKDEVVSNLQESG